MVEVLVIIAIIVWFIYRQANGSVPEEKQQAEFEEHGEPLFEFDVKEEGICLGLRKYAVEPDPLGRKPVWYVYQAAGTSREEEVFKPYLIYIQIKDWDEIHVKL